MASGRLSALAISLLLALPSFAAWPATARDAYEDVVDPDSLPDPSPPTLPERGVWGNSIEREPNTPEDRNDHLMWSKPDAGSDWHEHVYLDGFLVQDAGGDLSTPVSGPMGTKYRAFAFFGTWRDCNGDGYIGDAASGLLEYRAEVTHDAALCPRGSHWDDGSWVREFRWIRPTLDPRGWTQSVIDAQARVWADFGGPGEDIRSADDQVYPLPARSLEDASTLPEWATRLAGSPVDAPSVSDPAGAYAARVLEREQSKDGASSASAPVDERCDPDASAATTPPPDDPDGPLGPVAPVPYVALVPTLREWDAAASDCLGVGPTPASEPRDPVRVEWSPSVGKDHADFVLRYHEPATGAAAAPLVGGDTRAFDASRGAGAVACTTSQCEGWWSDAVSLFSPRVNVGAVGLVDPRATTQTDARPSDAREFTTNAFVSSSAVMMYGLALPGSVIRYGAEHCGTRTTGSAGGWDCDASHWGASSASVRVGDLVDVRDVDPLRGVEVIESAPPRDRDADGDRMGDAWARSYLSAARDRLDDPDGDCVTNFGEWAWGLYPVSVHPASGQSLLSFDDEDVDQMKDAQEIARWNSLAPDEFSYFQTSACAARWGERFSNTASPLPLGVPGTARHDDDAALDTDHDGVPNILDPDSDNDGLSDGEEYNTYGTYPEYADSDCALAPPSGTCPISKGTRYDATGASTAGTGDGIPDADEIRYWEALHGAGAAQQDCDDDGIINVLDADSDNDGILDGDEMTAAQPSDPCGRDADNDGLDDAFERQLGTDPTWYDSDHDGMPDGWEVTMGLDPRVDDAAFDNDEDLMTNGAEYHYKCPASWFEPQDGTCTKGTNALIQDTDQDGIGDGIEYASLVLDPTVNDRRLDADNDTLSNALEYILGTDAGDPDTDHDGLRDDVEVADQVWTDLGPGVQVPTGGSSLMLANATDDDTDQDGLTDGNELAYWKSRSPNAVYDDYDNDSAGSLPCSTGECFGIHLASNLRDADADGDRLDDGQEVLVFLTDPTKNDTDADGSSDYNEVFACHSNPNDAADTCGETRDPRQDSDADGIPDVDETNAYCTDPQNADTDHDLLDDKTEIRAWKTSDTTTDLYRDFDGDGPYCHGAPTNLLDPDADDDGLVDGVEFASGGLPREFFYVSSPRDPDVDHDHLLDGEESHNDLVGDAVACAQQDASLSKTLADSWNAHLLARLSGPQPGAPTWIVHDGCASIVGAYGVPLYAARTASAPSCVPRGANRDCDITPYASSSPTDGTCSWAGRYNDCAQTDPTYSANDETNTDGDGLEYDGDEVHTYHTGPGSADTDQDGLKDDLEIRLAGITDTDGDGNENANDADADGDNINDGKERTNGPNSPTDWIDADTDDDGLMDSTEIKDTKTDPKKADTDGDGLPDGLESGLHEPEHPATGDIWRFTDPDATFACGVVFTRSSFIPFGGRVGESPVVKALVADSDNDGLLDGVEDLRPNGVWDQNYEPSLGATDTDRDNVPDGLEVSIWGTYSFCQFAFLYSTEEARQDALRPHERYESDPTKLDTDFDGISDGADIEPNAIAQMRLEFGTLQLKDWADDLSHGYPADWVYAMEPILGIHWGVPGGARAALETPTRLATDWLVVDPRPFTDILRKDAFAVTQAPMGFGSTLLLGLSAGAMNLRIPDDVASYTITDAQTAKLHVDLHLVDEDPGPDDVIDVNVGENPSGEDLADLGFDVEIAQTPIGDHRDPDIRSSGENDGDGWMLTDTDGEISLAFHDLISKVTFDRAIVAKTHQVPMPSGECRGMGACAGPAIETER